MGDKKYCQPQLSFQFIQEIEHLCLNRYIQSRNRLIRNDKTWLGRQHSGNTDSLPLSTRKFVRIPA